MRFFSRRPAYGPEDIDPDKEIKRLLAENKSLSTVHDNHKHQGKSGKALLKVVQNEQRLHILLAERPELYEEVLQKIEPGLNPLYILKEIEAYDKINGLLFQTEQDRNMMGDIAQMLIAEHGSFITILERIQNRYRLQDRLEFEGVDHKVEVAENQAQMHSKMAEIRAQYDGTKIEPMGYIVDTDDGKLELHFFDFDMDLPTSIREVVTTRFVKGQKKLWHGHPQYDVMAGLAKQMEHPIGKAIDDGDLNKPSFLDVQFNIVDSLTTAYIAVPDGIIELRKDNTELIDVIKNWLNKVGTNPKHSQHLYRDYATMLIYTLMKKINIENYTVSSWIQLHTALGFRVCFYPKEAVANGKLAPTIDERPDKEKMAQITAYWHQGNQLDREITENLRALYRELSK